MAHHRTFSPTSSVDHRKMWILSRALVKDFDMRISSRRFYGVSKGFDRVLQVVMPVYRVSERFLECEISSLSLDS